MPPSDRTRLERLRDRLLVPAAVVAIAGWRAIDGDLSEPTWMSREGEALLSGSPLVHPDRWSWAPQPWDFVPTSPGWEVLSALAWRGIGTLGFHLLAFATVATGLAALAWIARSLGASRTTTVLGLVVTSTLAVGIMTARAGLPAFVLLLVALRVTSLRAPHLLRSSWRSSAALIASFDFTVVYAGSWLHGSWALFSLVLAGGQALLLLRTPGLLRSVSLAAVGGCAGILATLVGPVGPIIWPNMLRVAAACRGLVKEWTSPWQLGDVWPWIWGIAFALLLLTAWRAWRRREDVGAYEAVLLMLAVGAIIAGAGAVRFLLLGVIASMPVFAHAISQSGHGDTAPKWKARMGERATEPYWRTVSTLLVVLSIPLIAVYGTTRDYRLDPAYAALPSNCRLFSDDTSAKFVERYRPDVQVWIDGRQDYWRRERLQLWDRYNGGKVRGEMLPTGTECVLLERTPWTRLAKNLDGSAQWQRIRTTKDHVVWVPEKA